jgi:hypothetical protein
MTTRTARSVFRLALPPALVLVSLLSAPGVARAQGDGPRAWLFAPDGLNAVSLTWMELSSNYNFGQDILIPGADIDSDVEALAYIRYFGLGGRFAQIQATGIFGGVGGTLQVGPGFPFPGLPPGEVQTRRFRGFGDPMVVFRVGLVGAPALKLPEFVKHKQTFQVYGLLSTALPIGEYDTDQLINLGTNRWTFRAGLPMVVPLRTGLTPTYLEVVPSVSFFTTNDDVSGKADERTQDPLFILESHLTHNLTPKLWIGGDLRYQYGGETTTDGFDDDNKTNHAGLGIAAGYQIFRPLGVWASWGRIIEADDGARGDMWRIRVSMVF